MHYIWSFFNLSVITIHLGCVLYSDLSILRWVSVKGLWIMCRFGAVEGKLKNLISKWYGFIRKWLHKPINYYSSLYSLECVLRQWISGIFFIFCMKLQQHKGFDLNDSFWEKSCFEFLGLKVAKVGLNEIFQVIWKINIFLFFTQIQ